MRIIDTHCHYNLKPLLADWQSHWLQAQAHQITNTIVVGVDLTSSQKALEISRQEKNLTASVGFHPQEFSDLVKKASKDDLSWPMIQKQIVTLVEKLDELTSNYQVVTIGEIGLDYFRLPQQGIRRELSIKAQQLGLKLQLELAQLENLPVVIHARDQRQQAYWDILAIIKQTKLSVPLILHCFSGPLAYLHQALKIGALVGFAGNLTYPHAQSLRKAFSLTPPDRVLLETDAPYLPPQPFRGQVCEPWMITTTAKYAQEQLGADLEQIWQNSYQVLQASFRI